MLYTIISADDVFLSGSDFAPYKNNYSTNPYDYIRKGWYLDNSVMYRGVNNADIKFDYSGDFTGDIRNPAAQRIGALGGVSRIRGQG